MKIALGMSGGVDSSVAACLLKEQGHDVSGVYLECWRAPGCRTDQDRKDALSVALQLEIPYQVLDFKTAYREKVVEYFFEEYEAGRTPNPDVLCNREIKFGLFYDWAMAQGFDAIATGHYAQILPDPGKQNQLVLATSADTHKDQTYFLYRLRAEQLPHILFPIGHLHKTEVRELAQKYELPVATKKDSVGICFIGDINVHDFLKERLGEKPGEVVDTSGNVIGNHQGIWFYTIGQRHGFHVNNALAVAQADGSSLTKELIPPFYVIAKDATTNRLIVGFGAETQTQSFAVSQLHWINPNDNVTGKTLVRIRHTGALLPATFDPSSNQVTLDTPIQGIAPGQSAVFYQELPNQLGYKSSGGGLIGSRKVLRCGRNSSSNFCTTFVCAKSSLMRRSISLTYN